MRNARFATPTSRLGSALALCATALGCHSSDDGKIAAGGNSASSGGSSTNGGTAGNSTGGGATNGGVTSGGVTSGGVTNAGTTNGGAVTSGGASAGSAGRVNAGGSGGAPAGGVSAGGAAAGATAAGAAGGAALGTCAPPAKIDQPITKLSQTGCVDPKNPSHFAADVIAYEVNSPLWSDEADKARGFKLPSGGKIHVKDCANEPTLCPQGNADTGKWVFPVGTVMVKNFSFDSKLVETRLYMRVDATTWTGYSYAWDEAQTDASIVPDDRVHVSFNTGTRSVEWNYPNRLDCDKCHNKAAGGFLGPETRQMNRVVGGQNQLDKLTTLGAFETPPTKPYAAAFVTPYAGQLGAPPASATLEEKARSYMHANCAYCHRPDGDFPSIDLRYDIALKDMGICNTTPIKGDQGVSGALDLTPGNPGASTMWLRVTSDQPNMGRMPQIGTAVVDTAGAKLISDWITAIASCP